MSGYNYCTALTNNQLPAGRSFPPESLCDFGNKRSELSVVLRSLYRGADKSLARPWK